MSVLAQKVLMTVVGLAIFAVMSAVGWSVFRD